MFWSLFTFHGHSAWEPASIIWNDEQGDLFYSAGPHRNWCWPQLTQKKLGKGFGKKNAGELFDTAVTLKYNQSHWKWYEWVFSSMSTTNTQSLTFIIFKVSEKMATLKVYATFGHLTGWPALILITTWTFHFSCESKIISFKSFFYNAPLY